MNRWSVCYEVHGQICQPLQMITVVPREHGEVCYEVQGQIWQSLQMVTVVPREHGEVFVTKCKVRFVSPYKWLLQYHVNTVKCVLRSARSDLSPYKWLL